MVCASVSRAAVRMTAQLPLSKAISFFATVSFHIYEFVTEHLPQQLAMMLK
jgi:hypothetical protein